MSMLKSSVGRKIIMGVTGLILILFITGHVLGNMSLFAGPNGINAYAEHLHSLGPVLWLIRLVMLTIFVVHIWIGIALTLENKAARPLGYNQKENLRTGFASETMIYSGIILFFFVVYHVLNFTTHSVLIPADVLGNDALGRFDVYTMVVSTFQQIKLNVVLYIVGMIFLLLHVSHGFGSFFQSLGLNREATIPKFNFLGKLYALAVFLGYISIPLIAMAILKV
jgi:succinate dehydrogenase cytochrome b subunit